VTAQISDEYMNEQRARTRPYTLMLLKKTAGFDREDAWPIVWEHGRRNFALRADGLVSIILPVADDGELAGLCVFNVEADEVGRLMDDDPGVRAGIFTYELHPCLGFPGDALRA
jgi:hypothetical protein